MILDQLVRLACGSFPRERDLATVAAEHDIQLTKDDPWRLRYAELIDADWSTIDQQAWEYAAKDAVASRIVYCQLRADARKIVTQHGIDPDRVRKYGLLSQRLQVQAAISLAAIQHRGLHVDINQRDCVEQGLRRTMTALVDQLQVYPEFAEVFLRDRRGNLQYTKTGKPRLAQKKLREALERLAEDNGIELVRSGKTHVISLSRDFWKQHADVAPFVSVWIELETTSRLFQFFAKLQDRRVFPRYVTIVRTGRTSCNGPNIQQMPRSPGFREIFVPRPHHVFLTIDYSALELRCLAAVCETRFGHSTLADVIRSGTDPHCYTAALLMGIGLDGFMELKQTDPETFKHRRQAAKAVNFGVPGGIGTVIPR